MSNMENTLATVKSTLVLDAKEASYRVATDQLLKLVKEPLIASLMQNLQSSDPSLKMKLATFLNTDLGEAILSSILSVLVGNFPALNENLKENLSSELRISAMTKVGNMAANILTDPLINSLIANLK